MIGSVDVGIKYFFLTQCNNYTNSIRRTQERYVATAVIKY